MSSFNALNPSKEISVNLLITKPNIRLLQQIAIISAVFAVLLSVLIIVNYLQLQRADPLNTKALNAMVERLRVNPEDQALRDQVRELDLLVRRAFFTNQWQVKTGGLLLLCSILVMVTCLQAIGYFKKISPEIPGKEQENVFVFRKTGRTWIAGSGTALVLIALFFAWLTNNALSDKIDLALLGNGKNADSTLIAITPTIDSLNQTTIDSAGIVVDSAIMAAPTDGFPNLNELRTNFPAFRGVGGLGIAYQKNIPTSWDGKSGKNIRWKLKIPLQGYNSPIIWNNNIFLSGASEKSREVYCIDKTSGKIRWKASVNDIPGSPALAPKVNGETGFAAPSLTTDGRRVYAIFANGDLIALDFEGKKVWAKNLGLPKNHYGHSSSLVMVDDKLIVQYDQSGSANLLALVGKTGDVIWKTARNVRISWSSPIIVNQGKQAEIVLAADPFVAAYDAVTGKELWKLDAISGEVGPSPAYADGVIFTVNEYAKLAAIQTGNPPKLLWEDSEFLSDVPSPVATKDYLFLATSYGNLVCYEAKTGKKLWDHDFGNKVYSSPILVEGKIYILDSKGFMHIVKADKSFSLVAESPLGEGSFCTPAFADGMIIIRGNTHLYCISK